jgi:hypothetical protein
MQRAKDRLNSMKGFEFHVCWLASINREKCEHTGQDKAVLAILRTSRSAYLVFSQACNFLKIGGSYLKSADTIAGYVLVNKITSTS